MRIAGIVFDKDGTLFDLHATWGPFAERLGTRLSAGDPALRDRLWKIVGYDSRAARLRPGSIMATETPETICRALLAGLPDGTDAGRMRQMVAAEALATRQVPAAPLAPLLSDLRRRGLKLACVTNDFEEAAHEHLREAGVAEAFDAILGYDSGHGAKPEPGPYLAAAACVALRPSEMLAVGDSRHDVTAAIAAGMRPVAVLTGAAGRGRLAPPAEAVLNHVGELLTWLDDHAA